MPQPGYWALPYPVAERLSAPTGVEADGLMVVADNRPSGAAGRSAKHLGGSDIGGLAQHGDRAGPGRPRASSPSWN